MRKIKVLIPLVLVLIGLCLYLYPVLNGRAIDTQMNGDIDEFLQTQVPEDENDPKEEGDMQRYKLWKDMYEYNQTIMMQEQIALDSLESCEQPSFHLSDYGFANEVFGVLTIPSLKLEMPVLLGASDANMAAGAAHLTQTSLPIGGLHTNAVLAGHRGWGGADYFLYITELEYGDIVQIQNPWDLLTYEVCERSIIEPNDIESIRIQPGRDLLTLMTCHPYASGGRQRYLVICERVG